MGNVVVVGAGAMGLAAAYHAAKAGHRVTVLEAGAEPGGMAAHFDFDGLSIERFYHFICATDDATFELLDELGIASAVRWRTTSMGFYFGGKLHNWGDPISLLALPGVSLLAKLRYGVLAFVSVRRDRWDALEHQTVQEWIRRWGGEEVYDKLWKRLIDLKFHEFSDRISARWIWTRVRRVGRSRKSIFQEQLGYLEGGSERLVHALCERILALGATIRISAAVETVICENGAVVAVRANGVNYPADHVILTIPTPLVSTCVPALSENLKQRYGAIENIGVCCLVFKLTKSISPHFWVNISDPDIGTPGIIEFSRLRPTDSTIVYVPYYMPVTHPKFSWTSEQLIEEATGYLKRLQPELRDEDILGARVARLKYAQPICTPDFAARIPPVQTPIAGLQVADTSFYYPEDRGISESVRLGKQMAEHIDAR